MLFQQVGSVISIYAAFIKGTGVKWYFKTILVLTNNFNQPFTLIFGYFEQYLKITSMTQIFYFTLKKTCNIWTIRTVLIKSLILIIVENAYGY